MYDTPVDLYSWQ